MPESAGYGFRAGADSISARFTPRADMESAPTRFLAPETRGFPGWCGTYRTTVGRLRPSILFGQAFAAVCRGGACPSRKPCATTSPPGTMRASSPTEGDVTRGLRFSRSAAAYPPNVGADSTSARFAAPQTPRADMESAPKQVSRAGSACISRLVRYIQNDRRAGCPHPAGPLRRREHPREGHGPPLRTGIHIAAEREKTTP